MWLAVALQAGGAWRQCVAGEQGQGLAWLAGCALAAYDDMGLPEAFGHADAVPASWTGLV